MSADDSQSFEARQNDEFVILQSIYWDDIIDMRKYDDGKASLPLQFILRLKPQEGMSGPRESDTQLDLQVTFPPRYPSCCPDLKIEDTKGLSVDNIAKLDLEIRDFCKKSLGEVMILQVAQMVQEFLHDHDVRSSQSVYEEMVQNKQKQIEKKAKEEEKKRELKRRKEELQKREIEEELARREEEERKVRKMIKDERESVLASGQSTQSEHDPASSQGKLANGVISIQFNKKTSRTIIRGQTLGSGNSGSSVYIGMDSSTGQMVAVHHAIVPYPSSSSILTLAERSKVDRYLKTLNTIDQELQALLKLSHQNIVAYLGMKTAHADKSIEVDLLQEYVAGMSMQQKINQKEKVPLDVLRHYSEHMLMGLDYLHSKSVVHKQLKASSVFLDSEGAVKIADFSIGKRLNDLYSESRLEHPSVRFSEDRIPSRISKKGDILRLGIVILSLAQGQTITDYPPDVPSTYPPSFQDFLDKCLSMDNRVRSGARELMEHDFIKIGPLSRDTELEDAGAESSESDDEDVDISLHHGNPSFGSRSPASRLSRLHSEFEELEWLGKGGFGNVVQVRNKLDGRHYAIKRIVLKPSQSEFNKKITREVKLLSRLNHENVVRYYNSWIESIQIHQDDLSTSSSSNITNTVGSKPNQEYLNSIGLSDDVEKLAPPPVHSSTSEWSMSLEEVSRHGEVDEEDDDEEDMFKTIYLNKEESSDSIQFDRSNGSIPSDEDDATTATTNTTTTLETGSSSSPLVVKRYLYIQMEYCEKSTLRDVIDSGLCREKERMWRLFREILEGLTHVHHQGMIHRDLKPQNIFLDKNDHVKIGDFGLATSRSKVNCPPASPNISEDVSPRSDGGDSTYTGVVGTGLYVAPEILLSSKRALYSQKVDIYSLGIIFFEMSYPGIGTKMERVKVLDNLRKPEITFPRDFDEVAMEREAAITKWCLDHEPSKRPTSSELLKCRWVPTPILEESHVLEAVREMLQDPHSKQHSLVMEEVFNQTVKPIISLVYDYEIYRRQFSVSSTLLQQWTFDLVSSILERHGAIRVSTSLISSRLQFESNCEAAMFMDTSGAVVTLPYNLRVPFARFIVCNNIVNLKRYAIEKVFRARKVRGSRPTELWECTFDIVTPTLGSLIPDAEVISVVSEIISNFPSLTARKYTLRINHLMVLKALLLHCGLEEEHHAVALDALASCDGLSKSQMDARLSGLPLDHKRMTTLTGFIQIRGSLSRIQSSLRNIIKSKQSSSSSMARSALRELEMIKKNLDLLDVSLPLTFDLGFCHKYHSHYNGLIFQVSAEILKKRRTAIDTIAVGGRYNKLLESVAYLKLGNELINKANYEQKSTQTCVVGVSIAIEKVVAAVAQDRSTDDASDDVIDTRSSFSSCARTCPVDVFVSSSSHSSSVQERLKVVKTLWSAGIRAETNYDKSSPGSSQDTEQSHLQGVRHLVVLSEKDKSTVTVESLMHDPSGKISSSLRSQKVSCDNLVSYLKRQIHGNEETINTVKKSNAILPSGDSTQTPPPQPTNHGGTRQLSIEILSPDKLAFNTRKRYEYEIGTKLSNLPVVENISSKAIMCAIAVELPSSVIKQMGCALDLSHGEDAYLTSVQRHLQTVSRYKKYMGLISDKIFEVKFTRKIALIMLCSYKDDGYFMLV